MTQQIPADLLREIQSHGFELSGKTHLTTYSDGSSGTYHVLELLEDDEKILTECYAIMNNPCPDDRGISQYLVPRIFTDPEEALDMLRKTKLTAFQANQHTQMRYRSRTSRSRFNRQIQKLRRLEEEE